MNMLMFPRWYQKILQERERMRGILALFCSEEQIKELESIAESCAIQRTISNHEAIMAYLGEVYDAFASGDTFEQALEKLQKELARLNSR